MNQIDIDYLNLVRDILENGNPKNDRTGTGTISVFGRTIKYSFKDGKFPLLTTKKMAWKTMVTELLWFLRGDTNIKYLVDNGCHIWDGDAYKNYCGECNEDKWMKEIKLNLPLPNKSYGLYSQEEFINKIKTDDEFAKKFGDLGPVYGKQWRSWTKFETVEKWAGYPETSFIRESKSIDQIANVINLLKTDPDSRRMIVNAWAVHDLENMVLPPCHMMFQFYTRELSQGERLELLSKAGGGQHQTLGINSVIYNPEFEMHNIPTRAISLMYYARSQDVPLGTPFNISSYSLLLMIIAKHVNMVPEELIANMGDCHIYNNQIEGVKEQLTRVPYDLPTVRISDRVVNDISEYEIDDFVLENYQSHPSIKLPLSN